MFRSGKQVLQCTTISLGIDSASFKNTQCLQFVRGVRPRKPLFSGIAKSKLFKIPPRRRENVPETELAEIRRIERNYAFITRNIANFFHEENDRHIAGSKLAEEEIAAEEAAWQQSLEIIKEWNASIASAREKRRAKESQERELEVADEIKKQEEQRLLLLEKAENILRREKELSKTYITEANIDVAIQQAIDNNQDFNFAIDFKGNIYKGRLNRASPSSSTETLMQSPVPHESLPPKDAQI